MRSGDPASPYEPSWPYFQLLYFLRDQMEPKEMTSNLASSSRQEQSYSNNNDEDSQTGNSNFSEDIPEPSNVTQGS